MLRFNYRQGSPFLWEIQKLLTQYSVEREVKAKLVSKFPTVFIYNLLKTRNLFNPSSGSFYPHVPSVIPRHYSTL